MCLKLAQLLFAVSFLHQRIFCQRLVKHGNCACVIRHPRPALASALFCYTHLDGLLSPQMIDVYLGVSGGPEIIFLQFGGLGSISWKKGGFSPFQWPTKIDIPSIVNDLSPALHPRVAPLLFVLRVWRPELHTGSSCGLSPAHPTLCCSLCLQWEAGRRGSTRSGWLAKRNVSTSSGKAASRP